MILHEASFYRTEEKDVVCALCAHQCRIRSGGRGRCGVRRNMDGRLYSLVYGEVVAEHVDPIEKKPLFHILPGSSSLSISTKGCNFHCHHCQNNSISQVAGLSVSELKGRKVSAESIVENAEKNSCETISYTYVEPSVFFEFAYDCASLAVTKGIRNVFVSNGYISAVAAREIAPCLAAINIDIKSFRDDFYQKICGARLGPVLDCVQLMKELGVWVEVTTLLIPGLNDSDKELKSIASFLVSVDPDIPWHVTAFHPTYKMTDRPSTSLASLKKARQIGLEAGLSFVYEGNMPGGGGENTYCPSCQHVVIERYGFSIIANRLSDNTCPKCGNTIAGVWR